MIRPYRGHQNPQMFCARGLQAGHLNTQHAPEVFRLWQIFDLWYLLIGQQIPYIVDSLPPPPRLCIQAWIFHCLLISFPTPLVSCFKTDGKLLFIMFSSCCFVFCTYITSLLLHFSDIHGLRVSMLPFCKFFKHQFTPSDHLLISPHDLGSDNPL